MSDNEYKTESYTSLKAKCNISVFIKYVISLFCSVNALFRASILQNYFNTGFI